MNVLTLFRTVRYLRLKQIVRRLRFRYRRVQIGSNPNPAIAAMRGLWVDPVPRHAEMIGSQRFRLLNQDIDVADVDSWNQPNRDRLLLYHLHYLDSLNDPQCGLDAARGMDLIARWISANTPTEGVGWEPYPLSRRIVNWIKWHLKGNDLSTAALENLFLQARALEQQIEYHLLANHLLANAKALYFAGHFFNDPEATNWKDIGVRILEDELQEQVLSDGGHFELSPMYHAVITEDLLDILNISRSFGDHSLPKIDAHVKHMLGWLSLMTHPDGQLSHFNDTTEGVAASLDELLAYAGRLGIESPKAIAAGINILPTSGYARYQTGHIAIFIDIGRIGPDYQPGHAHCDLLSFELSIGPQRHLVNSGISTYNADARRHFERGTSSHNTVSIEGEEQSEIWSAFRVGRRAQPIDVEIGVRHIQAAHDGYRHRGIIHRRRFDFGDGRLAIEDVLESAARRTGVAHFHIHPSIMPILFDNSVTVNRMQLTFQNATRVEIRDYDYCAGFNKRVPAKKIAVTFESSLSTNIDYENSVLN